MAFNTGIPGVFGTPFPAPGPTPIPFPTSGIEDEIRRMIEAKYPDAARQAKENARTSQPATDLASLSYTVQALDATKNAWSTFGG